MVNEVSPRALGLTLLEMLVVLPPIGLLVTIALPRYSRRSTHYEIVLRENRSCYGPWTNYEITPAIRWIRRSW